MRAEEAGPPELEEALADVPPPPPGFLEPLEIGDIRLKSRLVMAPMAGYTNLPFRRLVASRGAGMVAAEMVSCQALVRRHAKTFALMRMEAGERPVSIQLFGADPAMMGEAASIAEEAGADVIDLNCGCPVKKITKTEAGSALLCDPDRAGEIVSAMVRSARKPVTVKMRTGWDTIGARQAERFARAVEEAGAAAITVHGRTRQAMFGGTVDLEAIAQVKRAVSIPVLGNGSILTPADAMRMIERTGVDGLMIGRGAIGNPWIFSRLTHWLRTGELPPPPSLEERRAVALAHLRGLGEELGERMGVLHARKHLAAYTKGMRGGAAFRERVNQLESLEEAAGAVEAFFDEAGREAPSCARRPDAA
ncbi:MAG: tRNA dihydrouridine synthase DusB [Candidatus Tectomicrobia bacterium]|uniref:tRNA-dihydrouridine synthase n=1 Tax=Tectimicrobiota bacterium TaxID=2528274 RepID=A0A932MPP0_UNCTE|nr:tRNA dihydrouridine synthase DusB [Candidatus Tectomicrobia bacterium]